MALKGAPILGHGTPTSPVGEMTQEWMAVVTIVSGCIKMDGAPATSQSQRFNDDMIGI
jgi:hypothetical protein